MVESGAPHQRGRFHAALRVSERYGLFLTDQDFKEIGKRIEAGYAMTIRVENRDVSELSLPFRGKVLRLVYRWSTGTVLTVLPND